MGGKNSKGKNKQPGPAPSSGGAKPLPQKTPELTESDFKFLTEQTGISRTDIKSLFDQFNANNPDAKLDRSEFVRLYSRLRPEPPELLDEIATFVFTAFDSDNNGKFLLFVFFFGKKLKRFNN